MTPLISGFYEVNMAERQNTKNPVPSNAMADLNDNTMSFDEFMNSAAQYALDRFGGKYKTLKQILAELEKEIAANKSKGFVQKSGDTMSDNLRIRKSGTSQFWLGDTVDQFGMYWNGSAGGFNSQTTSGGTLTRLRYSPKSNNNDGVWNFENITDVTIHGKSALKVGDYGIGSAAIVANNFTASTVKSGFYKCSKPELSPNRLSYFFCMKSAWAPASGDGADEASYIFMGLNSLRAAVGYTPKGTESLVSAEIITTANIRDYQPAASVSVGVGQTWRDVTSSRVKNTTYTNTTGKPIMIAIQLDRRNNGAILVDNVTVGYGGYEAFTFTFVVPNNSTYRCTSDRLYWAELR